MPPPRALAFALTLIATASLAFTVYYTTRVVNGFPSSGQAVAFGIVATALFGILTVLVSVMRAFIVPAAIHTHRRVRRRR